MDITTIGFDLAKTVSQVHGADGEGRPVLRRKLRRARAGGGWRSSPDCPPVLSVWKPVPLRTIGLGNCKHSGTKFS